MVSDREHLGKNQVIQSYNNIYQGSDRLLEMPSYYSWVLKRLNVNPGNSLLDIATGFGTLPLLAEKNQIRATGVDISIQAIKRALAQGTKRVLVCDGENLPFPTSSFDYATNLGSLEHYINPSKGVQEIHRILRPYGKAAIFLPNSYYLIDIIRFVLHKGYGPTHNQPIERFATINEWGDLIKANGLKINKVYRYNILFPRNIEDFKYMKAKPKRFIASLLSPFIPFNLSYSFLYICEKPAN
ncbi:MAG TPA: hypothetical protein DCX03_11240 [Bacteroidales bacterium]|nr:hypothetical protein [Bacteroidales bacterium]